MEPPIPRPEQAAVVVPAPGAGEGNWAGAPSAVLADGTFWLAYRVRRPVPHGRGVAVVLARSSDGVAFETVGRLSQESFGAASLERPALMRRPDGGWRIYLSCATPDSKHWWIEAVDADTIALLPEGRSTVALPGDARTAVKDPVVRADASGWRMWLCCHPLDEAGQEDRMRSRYASSADGLAWAVHDEVLVPRETGWDRRGTRITAVFGEPPIAALYDGRPSAAENWHERTGIAVRSDGGLFSQVGEAPVAASPHAPGTLRYVSAVPLPGGGQRLYYEVARRDGAHDLVTQLVPPA